MTVFENVAYGLRVRRIKKAEIEKRVDDALKRVRLDGYGSRTPDQLSGGQQQRVGLARAMAIEPRVLLLDEPLSNLDAKLRVEMRDEIRDIQKQMGITALYVTHDQEEALVISDRIAVVAHGEVQQIGAPWAIYKAPANLFVASFVGTMNLLEAQILGTAEGGLVRVRAAGRELLVSAPVEEYRGDKLTLAFRPEDAAGAPSADTSSMRSRNAVEGTVAHVSFLGSVATVDVDLGGTTVVVERHRPAAGDILAAGSPFSFAVEPYGLLLFDPESGKRIVTKGGEA
jgi:ABC-type Fe3+/spermidine/putrescine transport system ATPase subunit